MIDRPIFIVGPHRSGSTLWQNLIAMSPGILRLTDARFLSRPGQKDFKFFLDTQVRDLSSDEDVDRLVEMCFSRKTIPGLEAAFWRFEGIKAADDPEMKKEIARRIKDSDRRMGAIVNILLEEITRFSGYARTCVKFPVDVRHIPELIEWFPDCKIVHITRDPRALAMSKSNDPAGSAMRIAEHPRLAWLIKKAAVLFSVSQYRAAATLHARFQGLSNYRLFRYEDLLVDPNRTLRELCAFIEVAFTCQMLEPQKGRHEHQPSSLTGTRQKGFDAAAATRWQHVISPFDKLIVSYLTRTSMKKMGYSPKKHPIFNNAQREALARSNFQR